MKCIMEDFTESEAEHLYNSYQVIDIEFLIGNGYYIGKQRFNDYMFWKKEQGMCTHDSCRNEKHSKYTKLCEYHSKLYSKSRKYNCSMDYMEELMKIEACQICNKFVSGRTHNIDHDHYTNKIRGVLCSGCNTALGKLGDNEDGLKRALDYIIRTTQD